MACPVDSFCIASVHSNEIQTGSISTKYDVEKASSSRGHVVCDVCHIGHCSFIIASNFVTSTYGNIKFFGVIKNKIHFSEFKQNLFRPPIV